MFGEFGTLIPIHNVGDVSLRWGTLLDGVSGKKNPRIFFAAVHLSSLPDHTGCSGEIWLYKGVVGFELDGEGHKSLKQCL